METDLEYDLVQLPKEKNHLVSFSMIGSSQNGNVVPLTPAGQFGYGPSSESTSQVGKYLQLYSKSTCYAVPETDVFMYTDVGYTEIFSLLKHILDTEIVPDLNLYFQAYVDQAVQNVKDLYNHGKARKMFVQLIDAATISRHIPAYAIFDCAFEHLGLVPIDDILNAFDSYQNMLKASLNSFALNEVPNFDLTVLDSITIYENLSADANAFGIVNGETMLQLGWPDKLFANQLWFDSFHLSSHSNRIVANYVKTWFQNRICPDCK